MSLKQVEVEEIKDAERKRAAFIALDMDEWTYDSNGKPRQKTLSEYAHDVANAIAGKNEAMYPLDSKNY